MAPKPPTLRDIKALMLVFERFRRSRLWNEIASDDPVALRFEGDEEPWFAAVMGSGGLEFGVHLMRGLPGLRAMRARESDDDIDEIRKLGAEQPQVGFSSERWADLPPGQRQRLQRAGFNPRREASVPFVAGIERGKRSTSARAIRRLVLATAALLEAQAKSEIPWDERPNEDACVVLDIGGTWKSPVFEVTWQGFGVPRRGPSTGDLDGHRPPPRQPPPETARWRAADDAVIRRAMQRMDECDLPDDEALVDYFGTADFSEIAEFLRRRPDAHPAIYCWTLDNVRRPRGGPTTMESLLDDQLSHDERAMVEARLRASPTFVRIANPDADTGWCDTVDVLTGEKLRFHDWSISQCTSPDQVFAMTPVRIAGVILPQLAGPLLAPGQVDEAFEFLDRHGLTATSEGIARKPRLLGRLWMWQDAYRAPLPELRNTDGEEMEWHDLVLRAADTGAVLDALDRRDDVDFDKHEGEWTWRRENDPEGEHPMLGSFVHIARIQVIGDEILVSVNSAVRASRARAWLEEIPGVRFHKMTVRSVEALRDSVRDAPLDDRPSAEERDFEPPSEIVELLAQRIRAHYVNWMDDSIPALGGKTPREAVRTKKGRTQVQRLIHGLPSVGQGLDIDAIRQELLRELGLDGKQESASREPRSAKTEPPPPPPPPSSSKRPDADAANPWCDELGIDVPRLEDAGHHREANTYARLIVALLESGRPMTLPEVAVRFEEAGIAWRDRALLSLKRCRPARAPVYRVDDHYHLDPHDEETDLWAFRLGLRPPRVTPDPPEPEAELPGDDVPLTEAELDDGWKSEPLYGWAQYRIVLAALDALGGEPRAPAEVVAAVSARTEDHRLREDVPAFGRRGSHVAVLPDGRWAIPEDGENWVRKARADVRARIAFVRNNPWARRDPEEQRSRFDENERKRVAHGIELASRSRAILVTFPPQSPEAAALVDVGAHTVTSFIGAELDSLRECLAGFDAIGAVDVRGTLRALDFDPGDRYLLEVGPPQKTRTINRSGRKLKITLDMLVSASCGISRPFGDPKKLRGYLRSGEETRLRRRLEANAKSLYAFYEYGRLHHAVRLRWGFLDEWIRVPWVHLDEPGLYTLERDARKAGAPFEVVTGSAPGWEDPWARARRVRVVRRSLGRSHYQDEHGERFDSVEIQRARIVGPSRWPHPRPGAGGSPS